MPAKIAIIAALPREIAALVRGISPDDGLRTRGIFLYRLPGAVVIAAGMGALRATLAVKTALEDAPGATLISVGLAGGCAPGLAPGAVAEVAVVVDARTGERYGSSALSSGPVLVTVDSVAGVEEKARLAATYGASLVDMEAATVARLAAANGLRFRAIKAVSDAQDFELASLTQFTGKHGSFRTAAFALHTALRPQHWWKTAQLGRHSHRALSALTLRLRQVLQAEQG
jgi:adenosylhomocysteine nucleosidase